VRDHTLKTIGLQAVGETAIRSISSAVPTYFFFLGYNIHEKMLRDAAPITKEQELSAALDETKRN
jgi:hypothetical protein